MFVPIGTEEPTARNGVPWVTVALVTANAGVFLLEGVLVLMGGEAALQAFFAAFGVIPAALTSGQSALIPYFLTPLTSMFVHGSITHVLFNMLYLSAFGDNIEDRLGGWRYLGFYVLSGLLAVLTQVLVDPDSWVPTVGASGAIAGVLGAYLLFFPEGKVRMFIFAGPLTRVRRVPALIYTAVWFLMQFFNGLGSLGVPTAETGGVAYWAHIGGFAAGLGLAFVYKVALRPERDRKGEGHDLV